MFILPRRGWEIPESAVTPEALVLGRRKLLAAGAIAGAAVAQAPRAFAQSAGAPAAAQTGAAGTPDSRFNPGRPVTPEKYVTTYNNYYEFGSEKEIWQAAQKLPLSPWSIRIEGEVEEPKTIALDDLLKQVKTEERIYRHRCVEAWAITVPWTGFPMAELVRIAQPKASAQYVVFQTDADKKVMPGLEEVWYPWPYVEGLTIDEAKNELAFVGTGMYGKPMPPQNGGPIRMVIPWKYGFKSGKSFVKVTFATKRPKTFWETIQPSEYGFWANVNPAVPHPRWSQATERLIGTNERVPTKIYNGYGDFVAKLYADKTNEKLFM